MTLLGLFLGGLAMPVAVRADDADVLPKGVFRAAVDVRLYPTIDQRFDENGDREGVADPYNVTLDSSVFPALQQLEQFLGMPAGSATLGQSDVSIKYQFTDIIPALMYGVSDRLTVGIVVPYYVQKTKVGTEVDTSAATVGKNPAINSLVPLIVPGTTPLTAEDVKSLLGAGLDINGDGVIDLPGYGYEPFETWSGNDIGDIEVGFKYQYHKAESWRCAFTGGVRLPTGKVDDPDNLVDSEFGRGASALLFQAQNDYAGFKNLALNFTLRYDLVLPDHQTLRVPESVDLPITANKENVSRNIGDKVQVEVSGKYEITPGWKISLLYNFWSKTKDQVDGDLGFAYESLEDETDTTSHVYIVGLSYSTLPLFTENKFPLPLTVSLAWRDRFAGSNNALDASYLQLGLEVFF